MNTGICGKQSFDAPMSLESACYLNFIVLIVRESEAFIPTWSYRLGY